MTYRFDPKTELSMSDIVSILKELYAKIPEEQKIWIDQNCPVLAQNLTENE